MDEAAMREAIVAEARAWERTPYHHHARIKGAGVDCAQLPAAIYEAVGLIPHIEPQYSQDWMFHQDAEAYLEWVLPYAREVSREEVLPGDLAVFRFGRTYSHSVIITGLPLGLHASVSARCVIPVDIDADAELSWRKCRFFSIVEGQK